MKTLTLLLLFSLLLFFCWPLALVALIALPVIWLICLPFRIAFWVIEGVLGLVRGLILLPARLVGGLNH
jgi:hypothetical protein